MLDVLTRNNVSITGNGTTTIMFAHGFGCDQTMWRHVIPSFLKDYKVIAFDHVGSGNSALSQYDSTKYAQLEGYAEDVIELIEELGIDEVHFVGHSVSSMIGMLAAIERPELFQSIMMVGPSPCYINEPGYYGGFEKNDVIELLEMMEMNFVGWASYLAPIAMNQDERPELTNELNESFTSSNPSIMREFAEVTFFTDQRKKLSQLTVPTLILQCSEDSIVPIEVGEYLHEHIQSSSFVIMEAKGHYPHLSHPNETIDCMKSFLLAGKESNHVRDSKF